MQHDILTGKIIRCAMNVHKAHLSQAMNYLEAYKMEIGLLINFGSKSLEFKRIHNNRLLNNHENPLIK